MPTFDEREQTGGAIGDGKLGWSRFRRRLTLTITPRRTLQFGDIPSAAGAERTITLRHRKAMQLQLSGAELIDLSIDSKFVQVSANRVRDEMVVTLRILKGAPAGRELRGVLVLDTDHPRLRGLTFKLTGTVR